MPNYVSPGVYIIEKDISDYLPSVNTSVVGIVGFASKGPTDKPTLITNQNQLIRTFGAPSEDITGQAVEGALEILDESNSVYFVRGADSNAADASSNMAFGTCPSVIVSANGFGVSSDLYLQIDVYNNAGTKKLNSKKFSIPAGTVGAGGTQAQALRKIIGGGLDSDLVGVFDGSGDIGASGAIVGSYAGAGAQIVVRAFSDSGFTSSVSALFATDASATSSTNYGIKGSASSTVSSFGATFNSTVTDSNSIYYGVESLHPGTGYNGGTRSDGSVSGNSTTVSALGGQNFSFFVNQDGAVDETFKTSLVASGAFIENEINTGETNTTSEIIKGAIKVGGTDVDATALPTWAHFISDLVPSAIKYTFKTHDTGASVTTSSTTTAGPRWVKLLETTENLTGGNNGDGTVTTLVGTGATEPKTGVHALEDESLNVGIALVPGVYNQSVQNELITVAEQTQAFLALVAPPYAIGTTQDAIDWHNGKAIARTSPINSSYAAIFFPHVKVFSTFDKKDRWYDPTIFAARQMAFTDSVSESWFAPAGFRRGRLTKPTDVEVKISQGDRDSLYSGGNAINPISSFPQQGITIFGQRTAQRSPSALDRINVRRLMIFIRKVLLQGTGRFVFEPNDEFTWEQLEAALNPFLDDILRRRGLQDFRVICDETVNTPARVDRNELWCKVLLKPTKTAEIIIFELNLTSQSADITSL
jgi:phage tail sheath protein FI